MARAKVAKFCGRAVITASATTGETTTKPKIDIVAYNGGELLIEGFELPVVVDFEGLRYPETVPLNVDHEQGIDSILGQGSPVLADGSLLISGEIVANNRKSAEVLALAATGFKWQASIKAIIYASREVAPGKQVEINGRVFSGPLIHATESLLTHCAVLAEGADQTSTVTIAAKAARSLKGKRMSFEEWVASLGLDPATLSAEAMAALKVSYDASMPAEASAEGNPVDEEPKTVAAEGDPVDEDKAAAAKSAKASLAVRQSQKDLAASRKEHADEVRRIGVIKAKAANFPLIAAKAIEEGWSADKTELEVLKAGRPRSPGRSGSMASSPLVLEAALAMSRKIPGHEKQYSDQVLQAAHTQYRGRIGLQQVVLTAAAANGYHPGPGEGVHAGNIRNVLRHAFPQVLEAGFSTVSLPGIFSNLANKELLSGYLEEDQTWREVMAIKSVSDFKTVTSYRLLDDMEYEELGPTGAIKHGKLGEETYERSVDTYAKMFVLSRKSIINDDLGAFDDLRDRVGRGAAKKLNRLAWTEFLDNSTFFTSGRGNYITGATTTLLTDGVGLGLALDAFDALRSPSADGSKVLGGTIGGSPTILLTPGGGISRNAEVIYNNANLGAGTANSSANIYSGRYKPVKSVFLNDATITGNSATAWYLLRDPKNGAAVVVSFLDGVETPTVESAEADFETLGIQFRGYHDFGVDKAEYLCGVKSKGAA